MDYKLLLASILLTFLLPTELYNDSVVQEVSTTSSNRLIALVNNYRVSSGKNVLATDSKLCDFASVRSKEISTDFSHDGFWPGSIEYLLSDYTAMGENLARGFRTDEAVLGAWIKSPKHHEILLGPYDKVCIASYNNYIALEAAK